MVGLQGKNRTRNARKNRDRIYMELLRSPLHFSALKRKVKMSSTTVAGHLETLVEEGRVKRQMQGRRIVYAVVEEKRDQTVLEMRKECWNELAFLMFDYGICLTKKTKGKLKEAADVLKESIVKRLQDVDVAGKMMGMPETPIDKTYVGRLKIKTEKEDGK